MRHAGLSKTARRFSLVRVSAQVALRNSSVEKIRDGQANMAVASATVCQDPNQDTSTVAHQFRRKCVPMQYTVAGMVRLHGRKAINQHAATKASALVSARMVGVASVANLRQTLIVTLMIAITLAAPPENVQIASANVGGPPPAMPSKDPNALHGTGPTKKEIS